MVNVISTTIIPSIGKYSNFPIYFGFIDTSFEVLFPYTVTAQCHAK